MFDSHCHLDVPAFAGDRDAVLVRAAAAGVTDVLVPAIRPAMWDAQLALAPGPVRLHHALGIHPQIVPDVQEEEVLALDRVASHANIVAIGECGLDGATGDHAGQERIFRRQIALARELRLPLVVHVLKAHDDAPRILREAKAHEVGGIMHSYSGPPELVPKYAELGFVFSLAGPVTYDRARKPLLAARAIPDDLLLCETDAPDQTPTPHRGTRNEPAYLPHIVAALAAARGSTPAALAALTARNARRILKIFG